MPSTLVSLIDDLSSYSRAFCHKCNALTCALCAKHYFNLTTFITRKAPIPYNQKPLLQEQQEYIRWCEAEMKRLREEEIPDSHHSIWNYVDHLYASCKINLHRCEGCPISRPSCVPEN